ncbi:hypothetical protein QBC39DRAFT_84351 [Podospora conica]|nr:hypothetical protein QBC39DRAFT_84351 [Schizothecium conicum]
MRVSRVSLPHHHLARRHAVDASEPPPLANPGLGLDQESNISNPRHPYEQPQASHHTLWQYGFPCISEPIRKPPTQETTAMSEIDSGMPVQALNMRLSSAPQPSSPCRSGVANPPDPRPLPPTTGTPPPPQPLDSRRTEVSMIPPPQAPAPVCIRTAARPLIATALASHGLPSTSMAVRMTLQCPGRGQSKLETGKAMTNAIEDRDDS